MPNQHAPFILDEHGDMQVFASDGALLNYVEDVDVLNEEYEVWDSLGQPLRIDVDLNILVIDNRKRSSSLTTALLGYLSRMHKEGWVSSAPDTNAPLADLVDLVERFQARPRRRWWQRP